MKPDKGDWLAIVNVFAANGLGEACLSPFRPALCAAENRSRKGEQQSSFPANEFPTNNTPG